MRFKLRALFIAVFFVAMFCAFALFVERTWFGPARVGRAAQTEFDTIFVNHCTLGELIISIGERAEGEGLSCAAEQSGIGREFKGPCSAQAARRMRS
jgi:hypothetical protein